MTATVFVAAAGSYHLDPGCPALDTARLDSGVDIVRVISTGEATAQQRPACLVCASPAATEWTVTAANVGELWELIEPSKPHYGHNPATGRTECDGLTIWPHAGQPRQVARFGDTIRRDGTRYTVTSPNGEPR